MLNNFAYLVSDDGVGAAAVGGGGGEREGEGLGSSQLVRTKYVVSRYRLAKVCGRRKGRL